jgi:hypothetical protein
MDAALPAPEDARLAALLARWQQQHDVDALDELLRSEVEDLARRLRARAGGALSASTSASDLVQEAVLRCLRLETPPHFDDVRGLRGYLWTAPGACSSTACSGRSGTSCGSRRTTRWRSRACSR